ncbi:Histone transcription regulator [Paramyrothecium foliicola]|nr:Histone transcription regulator [Paramyrothecium foliicola]
MRLRIEVNKELISVIGSLHTFATYRSSEEKGGSSVAQSLGALPGARGFIIYTPDLLPIHSEANFECQSTSVSQYSDDGLTVVTVESLKMPAFQAINLEPEENVDEQVDTTKELHVDEALKRFQHALKLHAQGYRSRDAAGAAYDELFESEIFRYREACTEYERVGRQVDGPSEVSANEPLNAGLDIDAGGADGVAANLSLALYLSYKNYGQFFLDKLKDSSNIDPEWKSRLRLHYHADGGDKIMGNWTAALDQDPSDPELWRKAARFAASLNSGRMKRYCLEAAIELEDDPAVMEVDPPSLAEGLAGEQLKDQLNVLGDDMALTHPVVAPWLKKEMPLLIKRHLDPIPFLPDPTATLTPPPSSPVNEEKTTEEEDDGDTVEISEDIVTWSEMGLELMKCLDDTEKALRICETVLKAANKQPENATKNGDQSHEDKMEMSPKDDATENTEDKPEVEEASTKDSSKDKGSEGPENSTKPAESQQKERSVSVPTRKRSQSVAGLPEAVDEEAAVEKRSKRVRRRDTAHAEEVTDPSTLLVKQLQPYQDADRTLFEMTKNILEGLGVEDKKSFDSIAELIESCGAEDRPSKITSLAAKDLRAIITGFREETARVLLDKKEQATLGLSSFLEHAKSGSQDQSDVAAFDESEGLRDFAEKILARKSSLSSRDIAFEWVLAVSTTYAVYKWSDRMKLAVVHMLNRLDATLYEKIVEDLESPDIKIANLETIIPMLFELHIDIYERITNPSSAVDYATRMETKYRLDRWLDVASWFMRLSDRPLNDPLCARFLWASVMVSSLADNPVREHILLMWTSLRDLLLSEEIEPLKLPNNLVMPSVSPVAADREISKLTTMDFFLGLFQEEMENPIHVIETLEPVLNPSSVVAAKNEADTSENADASSSDEAQQASISDSAGQGLRDLWKFLLNSSTDLRLFLWSKLGDAYDKIDYTTKKFSCHLKGIEMIVADFEGETYSKTPDDSRRLLFMRALKSLDELVIQALSLALNDSSAFDIIDEQHIKSSTSALAKASCLLHVAALCDDEIRIGISTAPSGSTFQSLMNKLREMQVRTWCLQYTMFKAGVPGQESAIAPENELADYLAVTHLAIGLRKYCKTSNKIFLKMMRAELLKLDNIENWEHYLGQVLYDLHGLKLGVGVWEVQDHGCPHENLEKRQTMQLVEKIMVLANRMPMKDLLKSDLKTTIDHMQQTIGQTKSTPQMIHNLRNFTELLKKPIHPLRLYQALSGSVSVDSVTANTPEAALAKHGWFFLLGMIALTKFKGVDLNRRQTPGATDDLRIGATFLRLQLQFTADNWRAWFRLAECFDYELDEAVLWTADKMNKDRAELVKFQRNAIHCYTLALSHSRNEEVDTNDGDPLHDMYHKFAMRLYASSREPFAMEPFHHSDQERFFIENMGTGTFKRILHDQMSEYKVWKFAAKLFKMAMERQPKNWKNPYMLAKCFWKMHQTPAEKLDAKDEKTPVTADTVLDMLKQAVNVAYNARKSRNSEPILEPHYKMVAILHKMVIRGDLPSSEAAAVLSKQPFGVTVNADDHFASFSEPEDWEEYVIRNLAKLKDKDKSNWQHRIIMRHAKILFDEGNNGQGEDLLVGAKAAFGILRENMFTKTMVMNVWKCDAERPGRHHVYTEQYVRFMTRLLVIMSDQTNLELLLRRLRKKGADFYHFTDLWQTCCHAYLKLLRKSYEISPVTDDVFKALSSEEFEIFSERITEWAANSEQNKNPAFDCMRDAIELKKLNANLMKAAVIDELINDCYSKIFLEVAATLPGQIPSKVIEERNHAKEVAAQLESVAQAEAKAANPLSSILNPPNGQDSAAGTATPLDGEKTEVAPKIRRTGVRRPDVLRKAEQAIVRSQETPRPATAKSRVGSISSAKRGSQTPNLAVSEAGSDDDGPDAQVRREAGEGTDIEMRDGDITEGNVGDSRLHERGNTDSDMDNESDLSDVPDDYDEITPPGLLVFPNLRRSEHSDETSGEDADSESEGDDPDEVDEEHEEEEEEEEHEGEGEGEGETGMEADVEDAGQSEREAEDEEEEDDEDGDGAEEAEEEEEEETEQEMEHDSEHDHADDEDTRMGEADVTEHDITLS